jgi:hypothetical protein
MNHYRLLYVPCYFYKPSKNIKCDLCKTNCNTTIATIEHITLYICVVCIDRICTCHWCIRKLHLFQDELFSGIVRVSCVGR